MILVSKSFLRDFAYIAGIYDWSEADIEECKQATRENIELKKYWQVLAAAHRKGYNYRKQPLIEWAKENNIRNPFLADFDIKEIENASIGIKVGQQKINI